MKFQMEEVCNYPQRNFSHFFIVAIYIYHFGRKKPLIHGLTSYKYPLCKWNSMVFNSCLMFLMFLLKYIHVHVQKLRVSKNPRIHVTMYQCTNGSDYEHTIYFHVQINGSPHTYTNIPYNSNSSGTSFISKNCFLKYTKFK